MNNCTDLQDRKTFLEGEKQIFRESCFFRAKIRIWPSYYSIGIQNERKNVNPRRRVTDQSWCASQLDPK